MATAPVLAPDTPTAAGTVTGLVGGIISDAQTLAKQQLEMFKAEVREDMNRTRQALIYGGVAVALLTVGLLALVFGLVYLIDYLNPALPLYGSFLIFAAICVAGGVALGLVARGMFESFNPLPDKTFAALQDNLTGAKSAVTGNS